MTRPRIARSLAALLMLAGGIFIQAAQAQIAVRNQGYMPFADEPINYRSEDLSDPVARLEKRVEKGEATLEWEGDHGYLKSVLKLLKVPVESQTLVFSKTSFQYPKISADHPRALYYNDDIYVGKVHDGKAIEIVSFDARQGAIFYLLDEHKVDKPAFQRAELDCTQCHIAAGTRGVPGVLLRSVYANPAGTLIPGAPTYITDQDSPVAERWGGWYVSGKPGDTTLSMANAAVAESATAATPVPNDSSARKLAPLVGQQSYQGADYLVPGSDAVALLVLAHQTQMHNLITLTNYKTRIALYNLSKQTADAPLPDATRRQFERPAEQLLRYLLFANEAPLSGLDPQSLSASPFAKEFAARGLRDSQGRSLRDFDLNQRIFRYPCSYLIYSDAFDAVPEPAKSYIYHRLLQILTGQDRSDDFARLSTQDRRAVLEIVLETKPGLPAEWQDYARANHLQIANHD
ncbi:MAG TPA: hypothetical protein VK727_20505 [Steroidobacteraceae bacterium]|nr:hypothetical protein [Steroidobacteraceae bacterium]